MKKVHIFLEPSLEPSHENGDNGYELIPQRETVCAPRVTIDKTSCSLRLQLHCPDRVYRLLILLSDVGEFPEY